MGETDSGLEALAKREFPRLVGVAGLCCGSRTVAEEIAQEALMRLCRHWRRVRDMEHPQAWLYRVTINLASDVRRRQRQQRDADAAWARAQPAVTDSADIDASLTLLQRVSTLPDRQRQAVACRYFLDLPVADTATILDCAPGTVRALTSQAINALRAPDALSRNDQIPRSAS